MSNVALSDVSDVYLLLPPSLQQTWSIGHTATAPITLCASVNRATNAQTRTAKSVCHCQPPPPNPHPLRSGQVGTPALLSMGSTCSSLLQREAFQRSELTGVSFPAAVPPHTVHTETTTRGRARCPSCTDITEKRIVQGFYNALFCTLLQTACAC